MGQLMEEQREFVAECCELWIGDVRRSLGGYFACSRGLRGASLADAIDWCESEVSLAACEDLSSGFVRASELLQRPYWLKLSYRARMDFSHIDASESNYPYYGQELAETPMGTHGTDSERMRFPLRHRRSASEPLDSELLAPEVVDDSATSEAALMAMVAMMPRGLSKDHWPVHLLCALADNPNAQSEVIAESIGTTPGNERKRRSRLATYCTLGALFSAGIGQVSRSIRENYSE